MALLTSNPAYEADFARRFWSRVENVGTDSCWLWTGRPNSEGYGVVRFRGRQVYAHRAAYAMSIGATPDQAATLCHRCDVRLCVNPKHLFVGSQAANMQDMARKGRGRGMQLTHCANGHEFTPANTYRRPGTIAGRDCRICIRDRVRRYNDRKASA